MKEVRVGMTAILDQYKDMDSLYSMLVGRKAVVEEIRGGMAWIKTNGISCSWPIDALKEEVDDDIGQ